MRDAQCALIVPVPEAESAVEEWRLRLDPAARLGIPAHVTILFPFIEPDAIDHHVLNALDDLMRRTPRFRFELSTVGWFGEDVLYLSCRPDYNLRNLTETIVNKWPAHRPYSGRHDKVIPHLTIGDGAPLADMEDGARNLAAVLPIEVKVSGVWLMTGSDSGWTKTRSFELGF